MEKMDLRVFFKIDNQNLPIFLKDHLFPFAAQRTLSLRSKVGPSFLCVFTSPVFLFCLVSSTWSDIPPQPPQPFSSPYFLVFRVLLSLPILILHSSLEGQPKVQSLTVFSLFFVLSQYVSTLVKHLYHE